MRHRVFVFAALGIAIVYYYAPDADQDWVWLTPGSIIATVLWLAASLGFKLYVVNMGNYTATYGAIGGVMVLMLWFYISGLVILFGAEMNVAIERQRGTRNPAADRERNRPSFGGTPHPAERATTGSSESS